MNDQTAWFRTRVLERLVRYARVTTTSDSLSSSIPTTAWQLDLATMLAEELASIGVTDVASDPKGFVIGRLPTNTTDPACSTTIGFIAHLDTSEDAPGAGVRPVIHERYDGSRIVLADYVDIDPLDSPALLDYRDDTIVTSDGTTLLGADDKAGIAEIMTGIEYLLLHGDIKRPPIEIIFTPDEETGTGKNHFPFDRIRSTVCYTFDGGREGTIEDECFEAYKVMVELHGRSIHLGTARGRLVNAVSMTKSFLSMIPQTESPETTDEREGYYCPLKVTAEIEKASITVYIRDFEDDECQRRIETLRQIGRTIEMQYPGGKALINVQKQYSNMKRFLAGRPEVTARLEEAIRMTGIEPERRIIRGGTDGSFLSEKGIPTPNVFTGGSNFHSRSEWIPVRAMARAARVCVNLAALWAGHAVGEGGQ